MHFNSKLILLVAATLPSTLAAVNGRCTGRNGICIATGTCNNYGGQSFTGKCPKDANNIRCCDNIPCRADDGRSGNCIFANQCSGDKISGKCPGGSDFKCCVPKKQEIYVGRACKGVEGTCIDINSQGCNTETVTGKCDGPANIKCCLKKITGVGEPCKNIAGTCLDSSKSSCANGFIKGQCTGPSQVMCCPREAEGVGQPCKNIAGTCLDSSKSSCANGFVKGQCAGPSQVMCCPREAEGVGQSCKNIAGTCLDSSKSSCATGFVKGQCAGPDKVMCCPKEAEGVGKPCKNIAGTCLDSSKSSCANGFVKGQCAGPDKVMCCPKEVEGVGQPCKNIAGTCLDSSKSSCANGFVKGQCPGPNKVMCCPREGSNSNPVKPDDTICLSLGGQCKNQNSCKGTIHSGICSGGNDRKCCLPSGTSCQSVGGVCNVLNKRYDILKTLFLDKLCPGNNKCCISLTGPLSCQDQHGVKGVCINEKNCDKEYNTIYQNYALSELPCPVPSVCCVPKPKEDSIIINLQKNYNGTKKEAIIAAAREMLNNDYDKKFIAGVLGNIESEAKTGQFEDACYKKDGVCTSEILSERIPCYLRCMVDNFDYFDKYSNKIITEVGIDQTMKLLNNANECKNCKLKGTCDIGTKNEKHAGDSCSPKFGLGAVQWTPPNGVMKDYSEFRKTSGKNKPTVGECAIVEAIFLVKDLGSKNIYENWKKGERSPESAAYDVCMNYEKPRNMKEECPKRKGNASNIYKLM